MWIAGLLAAVTTIATASVLLDLLAADAGAQERPQRAAIGRTVTAVWALAAVAWGSLVAAALMDGREWAALGFTAAAAVALIGPVAGRSAFWSLRRLLASARRHEAIRIYAAAGDAAHEAQNLSDIVGTRIDVERLADALRDLDAAAKRALRP